MTTKTRTRDLIRTTAAEHGWVASERGYYDHFSREHEHLFVYYSVVGSVAFVAHHYIARFSSGGDPIYTSQYRGPWDRNKCGLAMRWLGERSLTERKPEPLFTQN